MVDNSLDNKDNNETEVSIKEFFVGIRSWYRYFLANWITIILLALLGAIAGIFYSIVRKPNFTATTTFVLEESGVGSTSSLGNLGGLASMVGVDIGGGGGLFSGDNIIELYKSRKMIQKTLLSKGIFNKKEELLIDRFIEFNELKDKWNKVNWKQVSFADTSKFTNVQDSVLGEVVKEINKDYLSVSKPDKKLSIIKVELKAKDQDFAKTFSEEIVSSVNKFYIATKTKRSRQNVQILQHKTDSVRAIMNMSISSAAAVADATPNLNPTRQAQRNVPIQRSQFTAETNKAVLGELLKNLELSKIAELKETPLIQLIDEPIYPLERDRFGKVKGIVFGGFLFGFLAIIFLIIRKISINVMK